MEEEINKYQRTLKEHELEWDKHLLETGETRSEYNLRMYQFNQAWYAAEEEDRQRLGMTKDEYISYQAQCIVDKDLEQCRARRKRLEIEEAERQKDQKK